MSCRFSSRFSLVSSLTLSFAGVSRFLRRGLSHGFFISLVGRCGRRLAGTAGESGDSAVLAQTARRWTRLEVPPFEIGTRQGRQDWRGLLKATERQLVLARQEPGMLAGLARYLFERTTGHIGSYMTLITRGCYKAIRSGEEALTTALLDKVKIDEASERRHRGRRRRDDRGVRHRLPHPGRDVRTAILTARRPGRCRIYPSRCSSSC